MPLSHLGVAALLLYPPNVKPNIEWIFFKIMKDLMSIIQNGQANIKLEVNGEDLLLFSNDLINRAKNELATELNEAKAERYLPKEEVKQMFGVCDATLWHWNRKDYLKPVKMGNKVRYRLSDIRQLLEKRSK